MVEPKKVLLPIQRAARLVEESKKHVRQMRQSVLHANAALEKSFQSLEKSIQSLGEGSRLFEQLSQSARRADEVAPRRVGFYPPALPPQRLKPRAGEAGVLGGVLGISVAEVVLHGAQVSALVGEVVAAGVPAPMGPRRDRV
jgi:hypothetical protein